MNEIEAVEFIERLRWGGKPSCPRCKSADVYMIRKRKSREREKHRRLYCRQCLRQFSVYTDTPLEKTHLAPSALARVMFAAIESPCGLSAASLRNALALGRPQTALHLSARLIYTLPIFGFTGRSPPTYFKDRCLPKCPGCDGPLVNTTHVTCLRCRVGSKFKDKQAKYAAEIGEWSHPSKEETWWKIARSRMTVVRREVKRLSRSDADQSARDKTSPD